MPESLKCEIFRKDKDETIDSLLPLPEAQRNWFILFELTCPEKAMAPHSSRSMRSLRVGHDWATSLSLFTFVHWRRKWQPTPVFLPGESQGRGSLMGCCLWGRTEQSRTRLKRLSNSVLAWRIPGMGSLVGCHLWGRPESDTTEAT